MDGQWEEEAVGVFHKVSRREGSIVMRGAEVGRGSTRKKKGASRAKRGTVRCNKAQRVTMAE